MQHTERDSKDTKKSSDRSKRIDEIVKISKDISIYEIFNAYGLSYDSRGNGNYNSVDCPLCGATMKSKKANIHKSHNGFMCYKCLMSPLNGISLIMELYNKDFLRAVLHIAYSCNEISMEEFNKLSAPSDHVKTKSSFIKRKLPVQEEVPSIEIAPNEILNAVYTEFRKGFSSDNKGKKLLAEDYKYLIGRGLSWSEIKHGGYFSIPYGDRISNIILKNIMNIPNMTKDMLSRVPGFFIDSQGNPRYHTTSAIGIPIINSENLCLGIHLRLRNHTPSEEKKSSRYLWWSAWDIPDSARAGTPVLACYPQKPRSEWKKNLFITEGAFKARELSKFSSSTVLSVQGVHNWRHIPDEIKHNLNNGIEIENIYVCYDGDMSEKWQVLGATISLTEELRQQFPDKNISVCVWDKNLGKGIDDLIQNKQSKAMLCINSNDFLALSKGMLEKIKSKDINPAKLSNEQRFDIFEACVFNLIIQKKSA